MEPADENNNQYSVINLNGNQNERQTEHINEAFDNDENDDVNQIDPNNNFQRNRPGTTTSIRSTMSTSSRSSVNCSTGVVKCPNLRLTKFFSYKVITNTLMFYSRFIVVIFLIGWWTK
jgi:hypothetical protein